MKTTPTLMLGLAALALGACTEPRVVSRAAPAAPGAEAQFLADDGIAPALTRSYRVEDVVVRVPETLKVSEANSFRPAADIVWRGDPYGDRRAQIATLMREALLAGTREMKGERPVVLEVEVARFHALTQKARYTVGGVHDINFWLTVRDVKTGEEIEPRRLIDTALPALGGLAAIAAEAQGNTQKVRISNFLQQVIRDELRPEIAPALALAEKG